MAGLGAQLAKVIIPGSIVYLEGDLGAGKTTLVRGFLRALGHTGAVKSPTFTVVEPYILDYDKFCYYNELEADLKLKNDKDSLNELNEIPGVDGNPSEQKIYHFDLYRLEDPEELEFMGIRDYLDGRAIALIEWPGKGYGVLPKADFIIKITHQNQGRKVELLSYTERGAAMISKIAFKDSFLK